MFVLIFILSYLLGVASTIAVLLYLYTTYVLSPPTTLEPNEEQQEQYSPFHPLPEHERAKNSAVDTVNYLFQFLFQEMKDSSRLRRYIMHKLNTEFNELKNSRTGKIFLQNIVIQSFSIGKECPVFSDIQLEHQERDERNLIKGFVAKLNVDYKDGFSVTLDVTLVFGQKCQLFIKVKRIQGHLRLEMRREPFCHWLLVFQEEPLIDFEVKSYFATRESPQLANIVTQQLRRAIRRKQTWPSYKIRYQPFFLMSKQSIPTNLTSASGNNLIPGNFDIILKHCDRLSIPLANFDKQKHQHSLSSLFLTVSINREMIADFLHLNRDQWTTKEIELIRSTHKINIKEVSYMDRTELLLDQLNPIPQTIEDLTEFKTALEEKNIFVFKIQGQEVRTIKQTNRVLKGKTIHPTTEGTTSPTTTGTDEKLLLLVAIPVLHSIRVQRLVDAPSTVEAEKTNGTAPSAASRADTSSPTPTTVRHRTAATTVKFDKSADAIALNNVQSEGEEEQVPTTNTGDSVTKPQQDSNANKKAKKSFTVTDATLMIMNVDLLQQFQAQPTTPKKAQKYIDFNEKFDCQAGPNERFLNICLWCKPPLDCAVPNPGKKIVLLGYTTVALSDIVLDAHLSFKRETQMTLNFRSPYSPKPNFKKRAELSTHKAYDDNLAHGFITIRIKHRPEIEEKLDVQERKDQFVANEPLLTSVVKNLKEAERREGQLKYINAVEVPSESTARKPTDHLFEDQTFPIATLCSCCHRKIWMKVGRRCRDCLATIHKKCQEKYNSETPCPHEPIDGPSKLIVVSDEDIKSLTNSDTINLNAITPSDDVDSISIKSTSDFINRATTANRLSNKAAAAFSALDYTARRSFRAFGHKNANPTTATTLSPNLEETSALSKSDEYLNNAVIIPSPVPTKRLPPPPPPPVLPAPAPSKLASAASSAYSRLREFKTKRLPVGPTVEAAVSAIKKCRSPSESSATTSENIAEADLRDIIRKCLSGENSDGTGLEHLLHERAVDDTALYAKAREVGPELFLEMTSDERKQRLDSEISRLQQEIDLQCQIRDELTRDCNDNPTDENEKRKLRVKIANIDEKVQALGALTILYCSGLKHWRTQMESKNVINSEPSPDDDENDELTTSSDFSDVTVQ